MGLDIEEKIDIWKDRTKGLEDRVDKLKYNWTRQQEQLDHLDKNLRILELKIGDFTDIDYITLNKKLLDLVERFEEWD